MSQPSDHLAPHNIEAEEAVLGAILLSPEALFDVLPFLQADDFFIVRNAWVWEAIVALHEQRSPIDYLTVASSLEQAGRLEEIGGQSYLLGLISKTPSALNIAGYANVVEELATRRRLIAQASKLAQLAHSDTSETPLREAIARQASEVMALSEDKRSARNVTAETFRAALEEIAMAQQGVFPARFTTGVPPLDNCGVAHEFGDYLVFAGPPGCGKSTLMTQMAVHCAKQHGPVLYVALEKRGPRFMMRMLAQDSWLPYDALTRPGGIQALKTAWADSGTDPEALFQIAVESLRVLVRDNRLHMRFGSWDADRIAVEIRRLHAQYGIRFVYIDTLHRLEDADRDKSRYAGLTRASGILSNVCRDLGITLVVAAQLNKEALATAPWIPWPHMVRDTGAVHEHATNLYTIYYPEDYVRVGRTNWTALNAMRPLDRDDWGPGEAAIIIPKVTEGKPGKVFVRHNPSYRYTGREDN